jgi:hypothetical protein
MGLLLVSTSYARMTSGVTRTRIEYRYIPRTFREEQDSPVSVSELFNDLFAMPSPWIAGFALDKNVRTDLNKYFISQG